MKRCPQCLSAYDDAKYFCEEDGAPLTADPLTTLSNQLPPPAPSPSVSVSKETWYIASIGLLLGILICVTVYFGFLAPGSPSTESSDTERPQYQEHTLAQPPSAPRRIEEPRFEEEDNQRAKIEETTEEPATSTPETSPEAVANTRRFNDGPISTGTKRADTLDAIVHFTDGTAIRVEAAWEDGEGVWYRRGGLVSFVERNRVKSIIESAPRPAQEIEVTP